MYEDNTDELLNKFLQTDEHAAMKSDEDEDSMFYIDRKYKEMNENNIMRKLKDMICSEMDGKMKKFLQPCSKKSSVTDSTDRLISHLESHILFLEGELKRKDSLIEKLVENNLKFLNNTQCSHSRHVDSKVEQFSEKLTNRDCFNDLGIVNDIVAPNISDCNNISKSQSENNL